MSQKGQEVKKKDYRVERSAVATVAKIGRRLEGFYNYNIGQKTSTGGIRKEVEIPLSIKGYVHKVIGVASSEWELSQMYMGWMPFL